MTATNYERALAAVLKHEGGYVDHPKDPGGPTNRGITQATLADWRGHAVSKDDVKALTVAEAGAIYRAHYWDAVKGDELPSGVDYATFDFAVNSGPSRSIKFLQACLGVTADGKIGPATLAAANSGSSTQIVRALCERRLAWMHSLDTWSTFGKGWASRVNGVLAVGLEMAAQAPAESVHAPPVIPASIPQPDPIPSPASLPAGFPPSQPTWGEVVMLILKAIAGAFRRKP